MSAVLITGKFHLAAMNHWIKRPTFSKKREENFNENRPDLRWPWQTKYAGRVHHGNTKRREKLDQQLPMAFEYVLAINVSAANTKQIGAGPTTFVNDLNFDF